jgi:hypothetical protein
MKLSKRSFPHPVLGNGDDVLDAAFQGVVEISSDSANYYIDVSINCSSKKMNSLIDQKQASFSIHVECSNTVFRKSFDFYELKKRISVPHIQLNDAVEVNVFACAQKHFAAYQIEGSHEDYGNATFEIQEGDILAIGEGLVFYAEPQNDTMKNIASIMEIHEAKHDGDLPMEIDHHEDKITITLSKKDFAIYKTLKSNKFIAGQLSTIIVLPALIETLHYIESQEEAGLNALRWFRCLNGRIKALSLENEKDLFVKAQGLLELPVRRALASAQSFVDNPD